MEKRELGNTHITVSKIGFGALTIGYHQKNLEIEQGAKLICYALDNGINFIDTAEYYQTYPYIKAALKNSSVDPVISTKSLVSTKSGMRKAVEYARKEMDRDVIDIFLLHEVRHGGDWEDRGGAWEYLNEAKAKGLIKAIGLSTHHTDVAEAASDFDGLDVLFPLINYAGLGIRKGAGSGLKEEMAAAIKNASGNGIGIYGMKVFGGGNLLTDYVTALDYVYNLPGLDSMMVGFGCESEIDDIVKYVEDRLEDGYTPDVSDKRMRVVQGDCAGCGACIRRCPNGSLFYNNFGLAEVNREICLNCGYCAPVCPTRALVFF